MVTRLVAALGLIALAGCEPEIATGAYYCGPERLCPEGLVCAEDTVTCVLPSQRVEFACPLGSEAHEPDDVTAFDAGVAACGGGIGELAGCIDTGDDLDLIALTMPACVPAARLQVVLRFPIGLMPLGAQAVGADGTSLGAAALCTPDFDLTGQDMMCLDLRPVAGTELRLRIERGADAPDCDGDCAFNRYVLGVTAPLQ